MTFLGKGISNAVGNVIGTFSHEESTIGTLRVKNTVTFLHSAGREFATVLLANSVHSLVVLGIRSMVPV